MQEAFSQHVFPQQTAVFVPGKPLQPSVMQHSIKLTGLGKNAPVCQSGLKLTCQANQDDLIQ
jgi:hypothetical protein